MKVAAHTVVQVRIEHIRTAKNLEGPDLPHANLSFQTKDFSLEFFSQIELLVAYRTCKMPVAENCFPILQKLLKLSTRND